MDLNQVYEKVNKSGIDIFLHDYNCIKAVTIEVDKNYAIFINKNLIEDSDDEFCVLAHEYGHCKSGSTHKLHSKYDLICRHEYRANRKAILDFLPIERIEEAIDYGCKTPYEFSVYLDVPERFVKTAIEHYNAMGLMN